MANVAPYDELRGCFSDRNFNDLAIFQHCMGLRDVCSETGNFPQVSAIAQQLAKHTLLVTIDCEHYTSNSDEMTEIGVCITKTEEAAPISRNEIFGDHGENLMKVNQFHLLRLIEKSHLLTTDANSRGPEGNRFGGARFVTFSEARQILHDIMVQPIVGVKGLEGANRPVILLGHSLKNDRHHLSAKDLAFDVDTLSTIIRELDTQQITVDRKYWFNPSDPVGLPPLVSKLGFEHTDAHTAANDAARTLMCAILMAIPMSARQGRSRSVQDIARAVELDSQRTFVPLGGTAMYCSKCGSTTHLRKNCTEKDRIRCDECASRGLSTLSTTHIALHCPIVRDEIAAERLKWYKDQSGYTPKYPFSSEDRLQTFAPNAPAVQPATAGEIAERQYFYSKRKPDPNNNGKLLPFVWSGRSFKNSPQAKAGPPPGSRPTEKSK